MSRHTFKRKGLQFFLCAWNLVLCVHRTACATKHRMKKNWNLPSITQASIFYEFTENIFKAFSIFIVFHFKYCEIVVVESHTHTHRHTQTNEKCKRKTKILNLKRSKHAGVFKMECNCQIMLNFQVLDSRKSITLANSKMHLQNPHLLRRKHFLHFD